MDFISLIEKLSDKEICENKMESLSYSLNQNRKEYKTHWVKNSTRNLLVINEISNLVQELKSKDVVLILLKGYSLIGDIYQHVGERFCSDVDLLITKDDLSRIKDKLQELGYDEQVEKKWLGNQFKTLYKTQKLGLEITLEFHTQLFWHQKIENLFIKARPHKIINGYYVLSLEDQLLHLCGHYAFQHTFLKLFWLYDIQKFYIHNKHQINWKVFWSKSLKNELLISNWLCLSLLKPLVSDEILNQAYLQMSVQQRMRANMCLYLLSENFLINPRSYGFRYLLIKFFSKDRLSLSFRYFFFLLRSKMIG